MEPEERVEETLKRQMMEELGIRIKELKFLGFGQDIVFHNEIKKRVSRIILYFTGDPEAEPEAMITNMKWTGVEEMLQMELEPGMRDMFERFPEALEKLKIRKDYSKAATSHQLRKFFIF